jgi:ribosomal protein S18 acetylase RimI-like enzyme
MQTVSGELQSARWVFRCASAGDGEAVVGLIESAYRGPESRRGWTTEADLLDGRRVDPVEFGQILCAPRSQIVLAEGDGHRLGCCHVRAGTDDRAYLGLLAVRPRLQGRGTGRALVAEAEGIAAKRWRARQMRLRVIVQREDLIAWYQRLGYRLTGERSPFPYDKPGVGARRSDLEFVALAKPLHGP